MKPNELKKLKDKDFVVIQRDAQITGIGVEDDGKHVWLEDNNTHEYRRTPARQIVRKGLVS